MRQRRTQVREAELAAARKTAKYAAATVLPLVGQDAGAVGS